MPKRIALVLIVILMLAAIGCGAQTSTSPDIATVNGVRISQQEFDQLYKMVKANYEEQLGAALDESKDQIKIVSLKNGVFDDLVTQKLVRQEAQKQGIQVSSQEIDTVLNNFIQAQNNSGADGYKKFLAKFAISEAELRLQIETTQMYTKLQAKVVGVVQVSDAEVRKYYDDNPATFQTAGGIQIYHILVDSEQAAAEVIDRIKAGGDFAALAKQYSQDSGSKDKGGDVGLVNASTNFVPEFKQAALTLQPGQLYPQAVKTTYGYHIIKAGNSQAASQMPFEQVQAQLKMELQQDQQNKAFSAYLDQLQNAAEIKDLRQK
ncbi:MAG: SurA N-terminal domain-containing protein [Firmicutes bacterium]|nr:SurA N-terminal domain-containing protein [Bacillota bacterium]